MPISTISQIISTIPEAGRRGVDVQTTFVTKQEDFQDHLQGTTVSELNALKTQINTTVSGINDAVTNVNTKAGEADADALSASNSAGVATTKAGEASTSASQASASKNKAAQWADNNYNVEVEAGKYSAKHWSTVAQNTVAGKVEKVTSTDNAVVRFNGTTGDVQNSAITIDDNGNIGSGTQSFNGFGGSGFKNYIINGNFDIWQRGESQTTTGYGSDDRWVSGTNISTSVHSKVICTDNEMALFNANYFSRTVSTYVSGTNSIVKKLQYIENITRLAGKKVTVSFWAKANSNKKMNVQIIDFYGSGGNPTTNGTSVVNFGNVDLTSTWVKYKLTATLPSLVGKTLGTDGVHTSAFRLDFGFTFSSDRIEVTSFGMPVGQSGTFDIAQVQLEEGSVATPFEQRPYGLELSLCQRYFEVGNTQPFTGQIPVYDENAFMGFASFSVSKRIIPTMTSTGANPLTFHRAYQNGASFKTTSGEAGWCTWTASAEL